MVERILEVNHETFVHTEMHRQKLTVPDYHSTELLNNDTILFILHVLSEYEVIALPNMTGIQSLDALLSKQYITVVQQLQNKQRLLE